MGFEGIGIWQLLIVLLIVAMIFGTKKIKNVGSDMGSAVKSFRSAMKDGGEADTAAQERASLASEADDVTTGASSTAAHERQG